MLRDGKNKSVHNWAPLPRKQTTASAIGERAVPYSDTSEQDLEDYSPAPAFRDTFSSALAAAFDQAATSTGNLITTIVMPGLNLHSTFIYIAY